LLSYNGCEGCGNKFRTHRTAAVYGAPLNTYMDASELTHSFLGGQRSRGVLDIMGHGSTFRPLRRIPQNLLAGYDS
jgi:hypothetical protein